MPTSYDGAEFAKTLSAGTVKQPLELTGLTKQAENDPKAIMFAEGSTCQSWLKIPIEMIDRVEYMATIACKDHEHPYVTLYLNDPPAGNAIAGMYADLLRRRRQGVTHTIRTGSSSRPVLARGSGSGSGSSSGTSTHCVYIPIIKTHRPPTGPEGYPADPGWVVDIEYVPVCWEE